MKDYNILLITEYNEIVNKVWGLNVNYCVVATETLKGDDFLDLLSNLNSVIVMKSEDVMKYPINDLLDFCYSTNSLPVILIKDYNDDGHIVYLAIEERIPEALEYLINENDTDLDLLLELIKKYMRGKGSIDNDNITRTSSKGKRRPAET